jgi:hypothetical protein
MQQKKKLLMAERGREEDEGVRERAKRESSEMHARAGGESERREPGGGPEERRSSRQAGRHETGMCTVMAGRQAGGRSTTCAEGSAGSATCPKFSCAPETGCIRSWVVMSSLYSLGLCTKSHSHYSLGPIPFTLLSWTNPIHIALLDQSHSYGSHTPIPFHIALVD